MEDLKNELINGKGYAVLPIEDIDNFKILTNKFIEKVKPYTNKKNFKDIREAMTKMSKFEINELMISLLSFNEASEVLINSCKNIVKSLSGDQIFLQRRANTIFNLPGFDQRRQWPHYELMSGVSPFTYVLWTPFHDLEDNDGVFYLDLNQSHKMIELEQSSGIVNGPLILNKKYDEKPVKLKFGEVIVFCPFVLHGNIDFNSNLARIACSVRFQSIHDPLLQKDTDYFKFYKL